MPWLGYIEESRDGFNTLAQLPSPETVRVLGEMLSDDWKWEGMGVVMRESITESLNTLALRPLSKLPFTDAPTGELKYTKDCIENLDKWKTWYSEVKAGRRTFRFIGDGTEYDLRGPVRRGGGMERDRTAKRIPAVPSTDRAKSKDTSREIRFIPYLVGLFFFLGGLVIYLRTRRIAA